MTDVQYSELMAAIESLRPVYERRFRQIHRRFDEMDAKVARCSSSAEKQ